MIEAHILSMFEDKPSKPVALWGSRSFNDLKTSSHVKGGTVRKMSSGILLLTKFWSCFKIRSLIGCWQVLMGYCRKMFVK